MKVGDIVTLKSGSPVMTVIDVQEGGKIDCAYWLGAGFGYMTAAEAAFRAVEVPTGGWGFRQPGGLEAALAGLGHARGNQQ